MKPSEDENTEWLEFREIEKKQKTSIWIVWSKSGSCELGQIKWYPSWRHYCFFPTTEIETIHSDRCLIEISKFITKLNVNHKNKTGRTYTELMKGWRNRV